MIDTIKHDNAKIQLESSSSTCNSQFHCFYQNVRGLRSKINQFYSNIFLHSDYDIIILTETWLNSDIADSELFPNNFTVFRQDRNFQALNLSRGGGTLIAVSNILNCTPLDLSIVCSEIPCIDITGVKILSLKHNIIIIVVYIPPSTNIRDFNKFFESLQSLDIMINSNLVLLGDFNVPNFSFGISDQFTFTLSNFSEFNNFVQYNNVWNSHQHILDLVFSNVNCHVNLAHFGLVNLDSHHPPLDIYVDNKNSSQCRFPININASQYNFKKANFQLLYEMLSSCNWEYNDDVIDVDQACLLFYSKLYEILDLTVPKTKLRSVYRFKFPPWFNEEIMHHIRQKDKFHKLYKKYKSDYYYHLFKQQRSLCKQLADAAYKNYISNIQSCISNDPKAFWSFIQNKKGGTRIPCFMRYKDSDLSSPTDIVDAFGEFFDSVYINSDPLYADSLISDIAPQLNVSVDSVTEEDILFALKKSKDTMTAGPDGIPSFLLRDCACLFVSPLLKLFNLILQKSTMPALWKQTCICPVYKSGDVTEIKNYRPISLLCNFAKIFETILYKHIYSRVSPFINSCQHGFVQKRSTVTNLGCFAQYVSEIIDNRGQVDSIYMDISKAFDQIDHFILLSKLKAYGFSDQLISFFREYLTKREQRVRYRNFYSSPIYPTSGVPQGSNLGPLLFLIFINDITVEVSCKALLFADDLKLFLEIKSEEDCMTLQNNIKHIAEYCKKNCLTLNKDKCYIVTYTKRHEPISFSYEVTGKSLVRKESIRDLGVIFDSRFMFVEHMYDIIAKAFKFYGFVYRNCNEFTSLRALNNLYFTMIRSRLEYACIIWYPLCNTHITHLETVQRKYLKFLCYRLDGFYPERGIDHLNLLNRFGFTSLEVRRIVAVVKFSYNLMHNKIDCPELLSKLLFIVPRSNSRNRIIIYGQNYRTNVLRKSPVTLMTDACNKISKDCDLWADSLISIIKVVLRYFKYN